MGKVPAALAVLELWQNIWITGLPRFGVLTSVLRLCWGPALQSEKNKVDVLCYRDPHWSCDLALLDPCPCHGHEWGTEQ